MKRIILSTLTIVACFSTAKAAAGSCSNYCTAATMADKCNHFGGSMENCMSWCNQYTTEMALGDDADTAGDTIGCRQYHLSVANSGDQAAMDLHCPHGGPTGGDVCGTHCEVYCGVQYEATCDSIYASAAECNTACAALPVAEGQGGAYATATAGNSVQCRLYHLSAAAYDGAELHCPHADQDGSGVCAESGSCSDYCSAATMADKCNHFGGSMENCMSWCNQYTTENALGFLSDTAGDTIGCRQYHLSVANSGDQAAMDLHCPHGGPTGGDVCGTHCDVYCGVQFQATCDSIYASATECNTACAMLPVAEGQGGAYATATSGNSVQCRLYHLSAAAYDGAELHCPHADQDGSGVCVAEEPTELVTLQGSATLLGLSIADWNAAAIEAFKTRVASALGKTSSDITIVSVNPMTVEARRMLLNSGIKVDYAVAGYASSAEVNAAKVVLMDKEAEISTALQADAAFEGKLSGLSLDVAVDGGGDTTSSASRTTHIAWLLVVGYTAVAAYTA